MTTRLRGKVFGGKGHISKFPTQRLWQRGLLLLTDIGRNMKNHLLPLLDKLLLRKRSIIEILCAKLRWGMGVGAQPPPTSHQCLRPYPPCLAAYTLAQSRANIGTVCIPNLS